MDLNKVEEVILKCINYCEINVYESYDVFDALNSEIMDKLLKDKILLRRIAIQLNARLPLNIRPLLGIKKIVHTKAISDLLTIYSLLYRRTNRSEYKLRAKEMFELLMQRRIYVSNGYGWGLNFPYTTRFIDSSLNTPNLYNTLNAMHSILDYHEINKIDIERIVDCVLKFQLDYLGLVEEDNNIAWIKYYPKQEGMPTLNVNATAASLFVRINKILNKEVVSEKIIIALINFIRNYQNDDGSWFYTTNAKGNWIDGFHTGFIIESLSLITYLDKEQKYQVSDILIKGADYFVKNLITKGNIPKYFDNSIFPIEAQNCAQAIQTLAKLKIYSGIQYPFLVDAVVNNVINILYNPKGYFHYKKSKLFTHKQFYMRWSQTPMILGLLYATENI